MEAIDEVGGLLGKIMPPRLEDAGLEDCALPPESIKEAFLKAATAVRSVISASSDDEEAEANYCVNDPWPKPEDSSDVLVGITEGVDDVPGGCATEKGGGLPEVDRDVVAVQDADEKADEVVVEGPTVPDSGEACVDGLQGLEIGEKSRGIKGKKFKDGDVDNVDDDADVDSEEEDGEKPILAEGYV